MNEQQTAENKPKPWDRQQGESEKSFQLFKLYLDLGRIRSLRKLSDITGFSFRSIGGYSTRNDWQERAEKYDLKEFEEDNEKLIIAIESSAIRQFEQKMDLTEIVQDLISALIPHLKKFGEEYQNVDILKMIRYLNSMINTIIGLYKVSHYSLNLDPINDIMDKDIRNNRYIRRRRLQNINDNQGSKSFNSMMEELQNITNALQSKQIPLLNEDNQT